MNLRLASLEKHEKTDAVAIPVFEKEIQDHPAFRKAEKSLAALILKTAASEDFSAKRDQVWVFHTHQKLGTDRLLLLGLGPRAKYEPELLRMASGSAARALSKLRATSVLFDLRALPDSEASVSAVVEGILLGDYRYDRFRSARSADKETPHLRDVLLLTSEPDAAKLKPIIRLSTKIAEATNWARDLVNEPAATLTPTRLAEHAQELAEQAGLEISVGDRERIAELKMGLFLGVAKGSSEEPRLIHLAYIPRDPEHAKERPLALVGKAITFDSGGLSLKTTEGMLDMKSDMAGAAAVLGAMRVIALLRPPFPVRAFMGACENMPSGTAYRLGDVLTSRLGKTVEVTNTDAEGRLVLGDMLAWANEHNPSEIIDLATLTGACVVALGHYIAGAFGQDEPMIKSLLAAGASAGERFWQMPITELQRDALKSEIADLKNAGDRWGAAISAALFLKEFVGDTPWVHLDIAGPSMSPKERGYFSKGATGMGVRTLVEYVRRRSLESTISA